MFYIIYSIYTYTEYIYIYKDQIRLRRRHNDEVLVLNAQLAQAGHHLEVIESCRGYG